MEDVSGHSLRATWVDPVPVGRLSLASFRASTPPPPMRPVKPTPAAEPKPPPVPVTDEVDALPVATPKKKLVVIAAIALAALAVVGFLLIRSGSSPEPSGPGPSEGARGASPAAAAPPAVVPPTAPSAETTAPPESSGSRPRKKGTALPAKPEASAKSTSPGPPTPVKPKGGYAEDLGF
jgi:hypothetical protein